MDLRNRTQGNISENSKKAEEILIFQECCRTHLVHLYRQYIALFPDEWRQIKLGRSKAILCISYELTVQPQIHCLFHSFKADTDSLRAQLRIQIKAFDIGTYRIILSFAEHSGSVSGALHAVGASAVFFSLPWVHGIDVADLIISSQFNMARHHDLIKVFRIKILFIEVFRSALNILTENKFPLSI